MFPALAAAPSVRPPPLRGRTGGREGGGSLGTVGRPPEGAAARRPPASAFFCSLFFGLGCPPVLPFTPSNEASMPTKDPDPVPPVSPTMAALLRRAAERLRAAASATAAFAQEEETK